MFILNLNVNISRSITIHVIRNLSVFPIHSPIILKLQTVTLFVWGPCGNLYDSWNEFYLRAFLESPETFRARYFTLYLVHKEDFSEHVTLYLKKTCENKSVVE